MNPRICICCGEPIAENGHGLSRNPNVCASCSSMADGMEETTLPPAPEPIVNAPILDETRPPLSPDEPHEEIVLEWSLGRVRKRE